MGVVRCAASAIALAGCYSGAGEAPCSISCDFVANRACPGELTCRSDNRCHASGEDCFDSYALAVMADHPIAYWRLDDPAGSTTAVDLMHLVDGKYTGNCLLGQPGALSTDTAVRFDGQTCWVYLDDVPQLRFPANSPYTIEAWVDADAVPGYRHIFTREVRAGAPMDGYALLFSGPGVAQAERTVATQNIYAKAAIPALGFYHVAAVYDGSNLDLYIDGIAGLPVVAQMVMPIFPSPAFIGAAGPTDNVFQGVLDEIAIYDQALTPEQLQKHIAARD
jgi:hypothetical protein